MAPRPRAEQRYYATPGGMTFDTFYQPGITDGEVGAYCDFTNASDLKKFMCLYPFLNAVVRWQYERNEHKLGNASWRQIFGVVQNSMNEDNNYEALDPADIDEIYPVSNDEEILANKMIRYACILYHLMKDLKALSKLYADGNLEELISLQKTAKGDFENVIVREEVNKVPEIEFEGLSFYFADFGRESPMEAWNRLWSIFSLLRTYCERTRQHVLFGQKEFKSTPINVSLAPAFMRPPVADEEDEDADLASYSEDEDADLASNSEDEY